MGLLLKLTIASGATALGSVLTVSLSDSSTIHCGLPARGPGPLPVLMKLSSRSRSRNG